MLLSQLLETAAGYQGNSGDLEKQFAAAAANNLTTVRMFGFGVASGFQLQYSPGSYNENAFKAIDKVGAAMQQCPHTAPCMRYLLLPFLYAAL